MPSKRIQRASDCRVRAGLLLSVSTTRRLPPRLHFVAYMDDADVPSLPGLPPSCRASAIARNSRPRKCTSHPPSQRRPPANHASQPSLVAELEPENARLRHVAQKPTAPVPVTAPAAGVTAGGGAVDEVAVSRARRAAAEASGLVRLEPEEEVFSAHASPAPVPSQAPSAPASSRTRNRSSSVSWSL
jgi:hypothetical protein